MAEKFAFLSFENARADLSPGDRRRAETLPSDITVATIDRPDHPLFEAVYQKLWDEFSGHDSMEPRDIIASRLAWQPSTPIGGWRLLYRLIAVLSGGRPVAVRDCSAIVALAQPNRAMVHLSHVLIDPAFRGGSLAAWMRTFPISIARQCLESARDINPTQSRPQITAPRCDEVADRTAQDVITLVAEMEYPSQDDPMSIRRLRSYERADFLKIDPKAIDYFQPDFRDPAIIDRAGGPKPLPYMLIVRQVGNEAARTISGRSVRPIVQALYGMYGQHFRAADMAVARRTLDRFPPDDAIIQLLPPTA